jgi:hypothetical protein
MQGVVFLDALDRKMILVRASMKVMPLEQSGIERGARFSFYDQVHTTGMDIKQALNAVAIITLGKDMSFRDFAQGAFRMRGIGVGQTLRIYMIPEVKKLIVANLAAAAGANFAAQQAILQADAHTLTQLVTLTDICAWLVINSMKTEKVQFNMLIEQCLENVAKKNGLNDLLAKYKQVGLRAPPVGGGGIGKLLGGAKNNVELTAADEQQLAHAVDVFRDRVDYSIANVVAPPTNFLSKLQTAVRERQAFIRSPADTAAVDTVLGWVTTAQQSKPVVKLDAELEKDEARNEGEAGQDRAYNSEQVQEQGQWRKQQGTN